MLALAVLAVLSPRGRRVAARVLIIALLLHLPLVMAGFWFGRNARLTGNPLYPLHLEVSGGSGSPGWYGPDVMRLSQYYLPREDWRALIDILLAVLDPRLAPVWVAALAGAWALGRDAHRPLGRWVWACSVLAVLNVALYWLVIPYRTQQRFMFQALGLAVVPLARLFDRGRGIRLAGGRPAGPAPAHAAGLALGGRGGTSSPGTCTRGSPTPCSARCGPCSDTASAGPGRGDPDTSRSVLGALGRRLGLGPAPPADRRPAGPRRRPAATAILVGAWPSPRPTPGRIDPRRLVLSPVPATTTAGWLQLDLRAGPAGTRIAYAGTNLPYYLMGRGLRNEVRYVNVDAHRDWLLHDYHREARPRGQPTWPHPRPGWDRIDPDYDAWLANLRAEEIRAPGRRQRQPGRRAAQHRRPAGFPIERRWAEAHPEVFEPLYGVAEGDPLFRIYRASGADSPRIEEIDSATATDRTAGSHS